MNKLKNVEYMLQFITHKNDRYGYVEGAIEALAGGCKWIQLRMKEATGCEDTQAGLCRKGGHLSDRRPRRVGCRA